MNISGKNREERNPPSPLCSSYQQKQYELSLQNKQGSTLALQPVLGTELRIRTGAEGWSSLLHGSPESQGDACLPSSPRGAGGWAGARVLRTPVPGLGQAPLS